MLRLTWENIKKLLELASKKRNPGQNRRPKTRYVWGTARSSGTDVEEGNRENALNSIEQEFGLVLSTNHCQEVQGF